MDAVALLQTGSAFLLNVCFAWLLGTWLARHWLDADGACRTDIASRLRRLDLAACILGAISIGAALLAATAIMADVGLREAGPMFGMMLTSTDYGRAGCVIALAMLALLLLRWTGASGRASDYGVTLTLIVFAITRASMGHAGEEGYWSVALAAQAIHYCAIGVWTGAVLASAWFVVGNVHAGAGAVGTQDGYLARMSGAAMAAVLAIVITGAYIGWRRVGTVEHLLLTSYGAILLTKVALVLLAMALGGYNKFIGLPAASRSHRGLLRVRAVLRIESAILLGALLAASTLTAQQPPATM